MAEIKIITDAIEMMEMQVDTLVAMLGHNPDAVLVTDLCTFLDLMDRETYPTRKDAQSGLVAMLQANNLNDVTIDVRDTLVEAVRKIGIKYPQWPAPSTVH